MKKEFSQKQFLYQAVNKFIPAVRHLASACLCDYFKRKRIHANFRLFLYLTHLHFHTLDKAHTCWSYQGKSDSFNSKKAISYW